MSAARTGQAIGAAIFLPAVVFITAFNAIVFANLAEVPYSARLAQGFAGAFLLSGLVCAAVLALALRHERLQPVAKAILAAGVLTMAYDILSPWTTGFESLAGPLAIETLILAVVAFAAWRITLPSLLSVFGLVGPLIFLTGAYEHYARLDSAPIAGSTDLSRQTRDMPLSPIGSIVSLRPDFVWPAIESATGYKFALYDETDRQYIEDTTTETPSFRLSSDLDPVHTYRWKFAANRDGRDSDYRGWVGFDFARLARARQGSEADQAGGFRGNVYHLVFDAYQAEAFEYLLDEDPGIGQPFTHYPEFRTSSGKTWSSVPEMLWSRYYDPQQPLREFRLGVFQSGLFELMFNSGVKLHLYPHYLYYCFDFATTCRPNLTVREEVLGRPPGERTTVDLWFLKLLPAAAKRLLIEDSDELAQGGVAVSDWDYGFSITDSVLGRSASAGESENPFFSIVQFREFLEEEEFRPDGGQYTYLHAILPHGPSVVDADCEYTDRSDEEVSGYLDQARCAHHLVRELMTRLEALDRLDSSLIIVQGDHGYFWHPKDMGELLAYSPVDTTDFPRVNVDQVDSSTWRSEVIEVRSTALMLVKYPGQSEFHTADEQVHIVDIAPTVLDFFDIPADGMQGVSIPRLGSLKRDQVYFGHNKIPVGGEPAVMSRYRRIDGRWIFEADILTLKR